MKEQIKFYGSFPKKNDKCSSLLSITKEISLKRHWPSIIIEFHVICILDADRKLTILSRNGTFAYGFIYDLLRWRREEARFEGAFGELIDVTAVSRGRGSHNAGNLNTSRTHVHADGDKRPLHDRADLRINVQWVMKKWILFPFYDRRKQERLANYALLITIFNQFSWLYCISS